MTQSGNKNKSLLFVSIDFPPARTSGIYRPVFFSKYLIEAGWDVTLLTATTHLSTVSDESLFKEIHPRLTVIRTSAPMPRSLSGKLYAKYQAAASGVAAAPGRIPLKNRMLALIKRGLLSPAFRFLDNFLLIPDNYIIWSLKNLPLAVRLIRKRKISHLLATSPPQSVQIMGLMLSYLTGAAYVTDFRNSWTDNQPYRYRVREKIEKFLERKVLRRSRAVINMSPGDVDRLLARLPEMPRHKLSVITNGYNEADFAEAAASPAVVSGGPLRLLYVGSMYPHSGDSTAAALKTLADRGYRSADLQLTIIGFSDESFDRLVLAHAVGELVANLGFKPHDDLITAYSGYDVMYLLTGGTAYYHVGALPGKIFEYMRLGKPILHAGIEGTTHQMLGQSGLETFVSLDDPSGIADRIEEMIRRKRSGTLTASPHLDYIIGFEWQRLAARADQILSGATIA